MKRCVGMSPGVKNNPLWLKAKLPENVAVDFDVRSMSPEGDIKCEIFGDGSDHASGYVLIHGGWNNSISIIARLDEHGASLAALQAELSFGPDTVQQVALDALSGCGAVLSASSALHPALVGKPATSIVSLMATRGPWPPRLSCSTKTVIESAV